MAGRAFSLRPDKTSSKPLSADKKEKRELEKQLAGILTATTGCELASALQAKIARARDQLLTFCNYPGTGEATNTRSERAQHPVSPAKSHQLLPRYVGRESRLSITPITMG